MKTAYKTIIISFSEGIEQLNEIFEDDTQAWGVSTLKQWIDSYESTRFTQIGENTAVITSEYNMPYVLEWLQQYATITKQQEE